MKTTTISYPSRDGRSTVHARLWRPDDPIAPCRGLVQLVHGMAEHVDRYEPFARFLTDHGFSVCANDHVGHGRTAADPADLGHISLRHGEDILVEDVHELRRRASEIVAGGALAASDAGAEDGPERGAVPASPVAPAAGSPKRDALSTSGTALIPNASPSADAAPHAQGPARPDSALTKVPYIIFGHSMGSYITRVYLTRHAFGVRASVICGTGQEPWAKTAAGMALTRLIAAVAGERHVSALVHALGPGGYARQMGAGAGENDWIAGDPQVVRAFEADPLSGQRFTVGGYHTLSRLVADARDPRRAAEIPKGLPMLFIAGDEDLVGRRGAGVVEAAAEYRRAGVEIVDERLYHGYRHEILNEPVGGRVMTDVLTWLEARGL